MRDWSYMTFGMLGTWIMAIINLNDITIFFACVASGASMLTAIFCGVSKVLEARDNRKAAAYHAISQSGKMCKECIGLDNPFEDCGVDAQFCKRKKDN